MAWRVCTQHGCHEIVDAAARDGRCDQHRKDRDRARGTRQQRGYDAHHDQERARYQSYMNAGVRYTCWRPGCGKPIDPTNWHLGHDDTDRSRYRGPECPSCNTATASRRGA